MQFQKGRAKTGGRKKHATTWDLLQRAAEIAAKKGQPDQTMDEFMAQLIADVSLTAPATALTVLMKYTQPKPRNTFAGISGLRVDTDDIPGTLERLVKRMAKGGPELEGLQIVYNGLVALNESRALDAERRLIERELAGEDDDDD